MDEVVQALEGSIAPMECFVHDHTERVLCSHEPDAGRGCATKLLWTRVQGGIIRSLQTTTLAELVEFSRRSERGCRARAASRRATTERRTEHGRARDPKSSRPGGREGHPARPRPDRRQGRDPRPDGPQRLRQVDARERDHGPPQPRGDRGQILFKGEDITEADPDERARMGLFMAFQYPVAVPGVTVTKYLRTVINAHRDARGEEPIPLKEFRADRRGGDEADQRAEGLLDPLPERGLLGRREEADGDPPARASAPRDGDPRRDRLRARHRRAAGRRQRRQLRRRPRHGRPDHHPLPADPPPGAAEPRARHVPGPDRQARAVPSWSTSSRPRATAGSREEIEAAACRHAARHRRPATTWRSRSRPSSRSCAESSTGAARLPRLGRDVADSAAGDRRDDALLHALAGDRSTAASTRSRSRPPTSTRAPASGSRAGSDRPSRRRSSPPTRPRRSTSSPTPGAAPTSGPATSWC